MGVGLYTDGWYIDGFGGSCIRQNDGTGVMFINDNIDLGSVPLWIFNTDIISVSENDNINVVFRMKSTTGGGILSYNFQTFNYVFTESGWVAKNPGNQFTKISRSYPEQSNISETFYLGSMPEDGGLNISIYISLIYVPDWGQPFYFDGIDVVPNTSANYKGEFHTAQRSTRISSVTKNDKTVSVGDSLSDIYLGTLYKADGEPTELWNRIGITDNKGLLRLMVEDTLRISPRPMLYFEGDIFGYIPYMALITINNLSGKYQVSRYSYSSVSGINRTAFKEFSTDLLAPEDYRYEFEFDFGSETKVTILP